MRLTGDLLPCATVFALLPDDELDTVDSGEHNSIYWYRCGCVAVRANGSDDCRVRWCLSHKPKAESR